MTLTKDTAISIGLVLVLMGAAWFASDQNTRLRSVEVSVAPIAQMREDLAIIKARLVPTIAASKP